MLLFTFDFSCHTFYRQTTKQTIFLTYMLFYTDISYKIKCFTITAKLISHLQNAKDDMDNKEFYQNHYLPINEPYNTLTYNCFNVL